MVQEAFFGCIGFPLQIPKPIYSNPTDYQLVVMTKQMDYGDNKPIPKNCNKAKFPIIWHFTFHLVLSDSS